MASKVKSVWAIDIGNASLKALHLRYNGQSVEVVGLDKTEHSKPLFQDGLTEEDRKRITSETLARFIEKNNVTKKDNIAIGVPGQSSFARFINLPPVEPKGIPKIVQYEAVQQIPFDINEVEWDWQLMEKPDSPEIEVGIFAIKNELINAALDVFQQENLKVTTVQMTPMALYNFAYHDFAELDEAGKKAIIIVNMGSDSTELVVCSKTKVWQRSIPIGGNNFTQAIADAFKLTFAKAEKLKRTAPVSKYAKQIFQAMRPVFTDMGSEIQRSIGYFRSSSRGTTFTKVVAMGGAMKLHGVAKYLQQSLQMPVVRPESFKTLEVSHDLSIAKVHEDVGDMGIVYGLAIQGLGLAKIESNLLPRRIARAMSWTRKAQTLVIAASMLLVLSLMNYAKTSMDVGNYESANRTRSQSESIIDKAEKAISSLKREEKREDVYNAAISKEFEIFKNRDVIPQLKQTVLKCLPNAINNSRDAKLYEAFRDGDIEAVTSIPRHERKQVFITDMTIKYASSLKGASFGQKGATRKASKKSTGGDTGGMMGMGMGMPGMGMPGMGGGYSPKSRKSKRSSKKTTDEPKEELEDGKGFIVEIEGFTPYEDVDRLFDPINAGKDKSKWGIVTWLRNLNDVIADGNSNFKLFDNADIAHFIFESGPVAIEDGQMPMGIGLMKTIERSPRRDEDKKSDGRSSGAKKSVTGIVYEEDVLVDPMTGEEISEIYTLDDQFKIVYDNYDNPQYAVNDNWFRLKIKLLWDNGEKEEEEDKPKKSSRRSRRSNRKKRD